MFDSSTGMLLVFHIGEDAVGQHQNHLLTPAKICSVLNQHRLQVGVSSLQPLHQAFALCIVCAESHKSKPMGDWPDVEGLKRAHSLPFEVPRVDCFQHFEDTHQAECLLAMPHDQLAATELVTEGIR